MMLVTCVSCKTGTPYLVKDYLYDLASKSGIGISDNHIQDLYQWGVIEEIAEEELDKVLFYRYLKDSIDRLVEDNDFQIEEFFDKKYKDESKVDKELANRIIDNAVDYINHRQYSIHLQKQYNDEVNDTGDIGSIYLQDGKYKRIIGFDEENNEIVEDASFEEVFSTYDIAGSFQIDFSNAEVIPYGQQESDLSYVNHKYKLLSNNRKVFNVDGFRVSYSLSSSGIDVHVSKDVNSFNVFGDLTINNIKPTFKWTYKENDLKNCFFDVRFNSTVKLGVSDGKYGNYYIDVNKADKSTITNFLNSAVKPMKNDAEVSIPLCKIKAPIPEIPTAFINLDLLIKLYAGGKAQLVLYNNHEMGFETKNGNIRYINELNKTFDSAIQASAKAGLGANISLEAAGFRLADVEVDGGLKAKVESTIHLYDEDGDYSSFVSDAPYSAAQSLAEANEDLKVCGDLSFHWFMDLKINTSKSKMSKLGFSKNFTILDDDNQVFGNLHHLENGHFVEKCTRKKRNTIKKMDKVESNKIVLDSYAEVLKINETYQIVIKALPRDYTASNITYFSNDSSIASVNNGIITALKPGSVQIDVKTNDGIHKAVINILVSTG